MKNENRKITALAAAMFVPLAMFAGLVLAYACGYYRGHRRASGESAERDVRVERVVEHDTVRVETPVPVAVRPKGTARTRLAVAVPEPETPAVIRDTVEVEVPLTLTEYRDSTYRAWVSGYMATLDSIEVYRRTEYIRETVTEKTRKKWGFTVGPTVGAGWNGHKVSPYVGVGVTWGWSF